MTDREPFDVELIQSGRIPWSFEELTAALDFANKLLATPLDDWDRARRGMAIEHEDGSVSRFTFNPNMLDNQLGIWLAERMQDQGLDHPTRMAHVWRFFLIRSFIADNQEELRKAGIVKDDLDGTGMHLVSENLFRILATAEYDGVTTCGPEGDPMRTFQPEKVIAATLKLDHEEDQREGSPTSG